MDTIEFEKEEIIYEITMDDEILGFIIPDDDGICYPITMGEE